MRGYRAIGIADHAGPGNVEWVVKQDVARPGDMIRFPDGSVVPYLNQEAQA